MERKLAIQWFVEQHADWERLLSGKPYFLSIQRDTVLGRNLVMFKYDQRESDMGIRLVQECRGLILDADTFEPVCVPFFKFFNYGEELAAELDWRTAWCSEKEDGSLMKVVKLGDGLLVSTNGTIDAYKAPVQEQLGFSGKTFGGLFEMALVRDMEREQGGRACLDWLQLPAQWLASRLEEGYTYMFELCAPQTKIVVKWDEPRLFFLGCRDNRTFEEVRYTEHPLSRVFDTPELFPLTNIREVQEAAERMDCNHEGFVVCDGAFNRVKVKSPMYVQLHHMRGEGPMSFWRGIDIVRSNELDEVLTYFPEFREPLMKVKDDIETLVERLDGAWRRFKAVENGLPTRKEKAGAIMSEEYFGRFSGIGFALLDGRFSSAAEWVASVPTLNLARALGYKS